MGLVGGVAMDGERKRRGHRSSDRTVGAIRTVAAAERRTGNVPPHPAIDAARPYPHGAQAIGLRAVARARLLGARVQAPLTAPSHSRRPDVGPGQAGMKTGDES